MHQPCSKSQALTYRNRLGWSFWRSWLWCRPSFMTLHTEEIIWRGQREVAERQRGRSDRLVGHARVGGLLHRRDATILASHTKMCTGMYAVLCVGLRVCLSATRARSLPRAGPPARRHDQQGVMESRGESEGPLSKRSPRSTPRPSCITDASCATDRKDRDRT
jgi:hypothetical protein